MSSQDYTPAKGSPLSELPPRSPTSPFAPETPSFTTLDVFTKKPYQGNPLAIIMLPSSSDLTKAQKQLIAREFNLSESIFLHQPTNRTDDWEWEVEIFTTEGELPFAGHPIIGAAYYVLAHLSGSASGFHTGTLHTRAGPIAISQLPSGDVSACIPHDIHIHSRTVSSMPHLLHSLSLSSNPLVHEAELHAPLVSIVKGMTFLLVRLPSLAVLESLKLGAMGIDFGGVLDWEGGEGWGESFVAKYYFVVLAGDGMNRQLPSEKIGLANGEGKQGGEGEVEVVNVRARMMEQQLEDPATGSAACTLGSYLALKSGRSTRFAVTQGVEMGRRSDIGVLVEVEGDGGEKRVKSVTLSGSAVVVMEGSLRI